MKNLRRMPLSLVLAAAAVLVLASLGWLLPMSRNSQAAPAPSSDGAFKGKVVLVNTDKVMMGVFLLEKAHVQKLGDRSFLVGKGPSDNRMGSWYKDRTVRLQMDHVVSITEFDDVEDATKAMQSGGAGPMGMGMGGFGAIQGATIVRPARQAIPGAPPPPPHPPKAVPIEKEKQ